MLGWWFWLHLDFGECARNAFTMGTMIYMYTYDPRGMMRMQSRPCGLLGYHHLWGLGVGDARGLPHTGQGLPHPVPVYPCTHGGRPLSTAHGAHCDPSAVCIRLVELPSQIVSSRVKLCQVESRLVKASQV